MLWRRKQTLPKYLSIWKVKLKRFFVVCLRPHGLVQKGQIYWKYLVQASVAESTEQYSYKYPKTCFASHMLNNTEVWAIQTSPPPNTVDTTITPLTSAEWPRPIGCLIFIGHFPQKSPTISGSFARNDLRVKAFYGSSPLCSKVLQDQQFLTDYMYSYLWIHR